MKTLVLMAIVSFHITGFAQIYKVEKSKVIFFSDAAVEDIKAENTKATSEINLSTQELKFVIKNIHFEFEKSLMKEHFNEKYMETERFKESTFQGKFSGFDADKPGEQPVRAMGKMQIHGQVRDLDVPGTMEAKDGKLYVKSKFIIKVADYKIKIPKLLWQNIAEEVEVTLDFIYQRQ